jgi:transglutaminase-like putative cysteine protease
MLDALAEDAMQRPLVRQLAALIPHDAPARSRAAHVLELVQRLNYRPDPPGLEIFQSAEETIARGGDCEDLATLFVALARLVGLRAKIVWLNQQIHGAALNHVYARVLVDAQWLDAECSIAGARLGEAPSDAARRLKTHDGISTG